jgi:multiple sugar transport system permease protein
MTTQPIASPATRPTALSISQQRRLRRVLIHGALLAVVAALLLPLFWALSTSLKPVGDIYLFPPKWIPNPARWQNYVDAVTAIPFGRYLLNTVIITALTIFGKTLSVSLVAFAFSRLEWRGRDTLFFIMLATLMLPPHVTLIPHFILFKQLGWIDTFLPLVVPEFFGGPFMIFLMRQFFMTIPRDLDDAARIDGASSFDVYARIIMPMSVPVLLAVVILVFNNTWNDFLHPLIYLQSPNNFTLALGLRFFMGEASTSWHLLMAAALLTMLPVLILFFVGQRYFIQGIVFTGVKA